jgi:hypothetical protein
MTEREFSNYFESNIINSISELENTRKSIIFKNYILVYLIYFPILLLALFVSWLEPAKYYIMFIGILICLAINWIISNLETKTEKYQHDLKKVVIPKILNLYSDNYEYSQEKFLPVKEFVKCGLSKNKFNRSSGKDFIKILISHYSIYFSSILTSEISYNNHRGGTSQTTTDVFRGHFIIVKIQKFDNIRVKLKEKFNSWEIAEDEEFMYFAKENYKELCQPSIFKGLKKSSTFVETYKIINEVLDHQNWK